MGEDLNGNGRLVFNWVEGKSLKILNLTMGEKRPTWKRNEQKSAIDLMLVNDTARRFVEDFGVDGENYCDINSDHRVILLEYGAGAKQVRENKVNRKGWDMKNARWRDFRRGFEEV